MKRGARRRVAGLLFAISVLGRAGGPAAAGDPLAGLPDPTRPTPATPAPGPATEDKTVLQSTLISPHRRLAIINGRRYRPGDALDGARIVAIRPYEVVLQDAGGRRLLRLVPPLPRAGTEGGQGER